MAVTFCYAVPWENIVFSGMVKRNGLDEAIVLLCSLIVEIYCCVVTDEMQKMGVC